MKTRLVLLLTAMASANLCAQSAGTNSIPSTNSPPAPNQANLRREISGQTAEQLMALVNFQTATTSQILGLKLQTDGALPQLLRTDNPLQLINPFAPARYGNGYDNVSYDPRTHRGEGIALLRIKF